MPNDSLIDKDGVVHEKGWDGQYHPKQGVFGPQQDKNWLGQANVERDWAGNPKVERDWLGNPKQSSSGDTLYRPSGGGSSGPNLSGDLATAVLGFLLWLAILLLFGLLKLAWRIMRWIHGELYAQYGDKAYLFELIGYGILGIIVVVFVSAASGPSISPNYTYTAPYFATVETTPAGRSSDLAPVAVSIPPATSNAPTVHSNTPNAPLPIRPSVLPVPPAAVWRTIFEDDFGGSRLDSKWLIENTTSSVSVGGGILRLSSSGTRYPYVHPRDNIFPATGDFRVSARFRYARVATCGVGILVTSYMPAIPPRGLTQDDNNRRISAAEQTGITAGVWQDDKQGLVLWYRSGRDKADLPLSGVDTNWHEMQIRYENRQYAIYRDGSLAYMSSPTSYRPSTMWLGHPVDLGAGFACPWDTLDLDSIRLEAGAANSPSAQQGIPRRIQFAPGSIVETVQGKTGTPGMDRFVLRILKGQMMTVNVLASQGGVSLRIQGADGVVLGTDRVGVSGWRVQIPSTQDYFINAQSATTGEPFTLQISIPPPG